MQQIYADRPKGPRTPPYVIQSCRAGIREGGNDVIHDTRLTASHCPTSAFRQRKRRSPLPSIACEGGWWWGGGSANQVGSASRGGGVHHTQVFCGGGVSQWGEGVLHDGRDSIRPFRLTVQKQNLFEIWGINFSSQNPNSALRPTQEFHPSESWRDRIQVDRKTQADCKTATKGSDLFTSDASNMFSRK